MPSPRLLDQVRDRLRVKHYSMRPEDAYLHWIRRYIYFHAKKHPRDMGGPQVEAFLSHLATDARVAAPTQNQALSALLFLYREVLQVDLPWMDGVVRAKRPKHLPVVLTENEVRALLAQLEGMRWLIVSLLYRMRRAISSFEKVRCASESASPRSTITWNASSRTISSRELSSGWRSIRRVSSSLTVDMA